MLVSMNRFPYQIVQRFSAGSLCDVHLAFDQRSAELVVLKTLAAPYRNVPGAREKMLSEGELLRIIDYPNVVRCLEMGEHQGVPFLILEYIPGVDLQTLISACAAQQQDCPLAASVYVVMEVLKALAHIHRAGDVQGQSLGLVHRDVKPANVVLGFDGSVRLIDFGIAIAAQLEQGPPPMPEGTLAYLAPEQIMAPETVDLACDIYAAGAVLYQMTTLQAPFGEPGQDEQQVLKKIVDGQLIAPRKRIKGYDKRLEKLVLTAMAKRPNKRFPKAEHMSIALGELREPQHNGQATLVSLMQKYFASTQRKIENLRVQARLQAGL